ADPETFLCQFLGTRGRYTLDAIEDFLRDLCVARLNDLMGETLKTILDLPRYYDELAGGLKGRVADDFGKYGLELVDFLIGAITPPEDVQKMIDERAGLGAGIGMMMPGMIAGAMAGRPAAGAPAPATGGPSVGATPCPRCQAAVPAGARFCGNCGQAMAAAACPKCNTPVVPGAKFCAN